MKRLYILAGANGSGKSTISKVLLPADGIVYVNPDDIAREWCDECCRSKSLRHLHGGHMSEIVEKMTRIGNQAVHAAQEENRRKGIPNVYSINGKIVWQLPDGTITDVRPAILGGAGA